MTGESASALYVHVPFCVRKCRYCDFFSVADRFELVPSYISALRAELRKRRPVLDVTTIYIGGGTPTSLSAPQLDQLLAIFREELDLTHLVEFTVEANPGTLDQVKLTLMHAAGVNRLSLGVQSFDDKVRATLGRIHTAAQATQSLAQARKIGFTNVSIDIIFAVPGQGLADLRSDLGHAIAANVEHISAYGLTFEEGTPLWTDLQAGRTHRVHEDLELEMFRTVRSVLAQSGFEHYEISNYARPGRRSQHNQVYWRNDPYVGIGPGAVSYLAGTRSTNLRDVAAYVHRMRSTADATQDSETVNPRQRAGETAMLGLRRADGIDEQDFAKRTGFNLRELAGDAFDRLVAEGLLAVQPGRVRLTERGLELADSVIIEFL